MGKTGCYFGLKVSNLISEPLVINIRINKKHMQKKELIGAWLLRSWQMTDESGIRHLPFGKDVEGTLIYSENGYMSANIISTIKENETG